MSESDENDSEGSEPKSVLRWIKYQEIKELVSVGKTALAFGKGCFIQFYNLNDGSEAMYKASNEITGDGVQCLAGHRTYPIFAFAEKGPHPRVLIFTYPQFKCIVVLEDSEITSDYQFLCFTELESIATLRIDVDSHLEIWCWRTQEKMTSISIFPEEPFLKMISNASSQITVALLSESKSSILLWDFHICVKQIISKKRSVALPTNSYVSDASWGPDNTIYLLDSCCSVFMVRDGSVLLQFSPLKEIEETGVSLHRSVFCWFKGGLLMTVSTEKSKKILHYRRQVVANDEFQWKISWQINIKKPISNLTVCEGKESCFALTVENELCQIMESSAKMQKNKSYGERFKMFTFLKPNCKHLVILDEKNELLVWETAKGLEISRLESSDKINKLMCNPVVPCIFLLCSDGAVILVDVSSVTLPKLLTVFNLCEESLSLGCFNIAGDIFIAVSALEGLFFVIQGIPGKKMSVAQHLQFGKEVVDLRIFENQVKPVVLILSKTVNCSAPVGDTIHIFDFPILKELKVIKLENPCLQIACNPHNASSVYLALYQSRNLLKIDIPLLENDANSTVPTGHQVRSFRVWSDDNHLMTYSRDGLIIIRLNEDSLCGCVVLYLNHRLDNGVKYVEMDSSARFVISLGQDKTLSCSELLIPKNHHENNQFCKTRTECSIVENCTSPYYPEGYENKSWLQVRQEEKFELENREAEKEKKDILQSLNVIRTELVQLLDENEHSSEQEQLPIHEFDLDSEETEKIFKAAAEDRKKVQAEYESNIEKWDRMKNLIVKKCWDSMAVKGRCLNAMGDSFSVENFALPPSEPGLKEKLKHFFERREIELSAFKVQSHKPWVPAEKSSSSVTLQIQGLSDGKVSPPVQPKMPAKKGMIVNDLIIPSSTSHNFIEINPYHCSQFELINFHLAGGEFLYLEEVTTELRKYFNERFDEMFSLKEKKVNQVLEKNDRLRTIQYESTVTCKSSEIYPTPMDPVWTQKEKSHLIIQVDPKEISSKPYEPKKITYQRKPKTDEAKLQREQARDSFRERALLEMMDGVLEVKWEDLLKKDIPPPDFMLWKDAEEFSEEELRLIDRWRKSVEKLKEDRENYKKQIDQEWNDITKDLEESVCDFDKKLFDLYLLRLDIEAAINQEYLIIVRTQAYHQQLKKLLEKEDRLRSELSEVEAEFISMNESLKFMEESIAKYQLKYDQLLLKDKQLEKKFRLEFKHNTPKTQIEQLFKLFKRRPKLQQLTTAPTSVLLQLSQCVVNPDLDIFLPPDCVEYLRALEQLDTYNVASHMVDETKWAYFCELRRQKIKSELKIKAACVELAEAEMAVSMFSKNVRPAKEKIIHLTSQLDIQINERTFFHQNIQVQIVLKKGIIEVPTTGQISDFDDAVLLTRSSINHLNKVLHKAGAKKIEAMEKVISFDRSIESQQWEYNKLTSQIEDLEDRLRYLEKFKVTREVLDYLQRLKDGVDPYDKGALSLEAKLTSVKEAFKKEMVLIQKKEARLDKKFDHFREENQVLAEKMSEVSKEVAELKRSRDFKFEEKLNDVTRRRLLLIMKRGNLLMSIQQLDSNVSILQAQLEVLRMKTYPTLKARPTT